MDKEKLQKILENHALWLKNKRGGRAYLRGADLQGAYLRGAYLQEADLQGAYLRGADLQGAHLRGANLRGAYLQEADLQGAYLRGADLQEADLQGAYLRGADLQGAYLRGADLRGAKIPHFQIPQEGSLTVWKKLYDGILCKLRIPENAKRTASLVGRKCRAEFAEVLEGEGISLHDTTEYKVGKIVKPDFYDDDIRIECAHGIHFFLTKEEAEEY